MNRILYSGTKTASSWAMRAFLALREARVPFREEVVDIRRPQRDANLARIGGFSPPAAVPVLVEDGVVIFDSLAIMEHANELCGHGLLPEAPLERARARSFMAWQHAGLSGICPRLSFESYFYPAKRAMSAEEQAQAKRLFDALEGQLSRATGPFLFGRLSLADLAFVPTVLRLVGHAASMAAWPRVDAWASTLVSSASVQEWLDAARAEAIVVLPDYMPPDYMPPEGTP